MNRPLPTIRWLRVLSAALAVIALSFLAVTAVVTVYAFVMTFQARGTPDQSAINHFAAWVSPKLMPWLEAVLTFLAAIIVGRKTGNASVIHGLLVGVLAGILSLALALTFGGRLDLHNAAFFLIVVGLGWLGGLVGQKRTESR
jgi:hypothetical protein